MNSVTNTSTMEKTENRRGYVTDEHKREAEALRKIYEEKLAERIKDSAGTQAEFGEKYEIGNQAAVGFFLSGKTALSLKAARGFALGLGVQIDAFSPRLAEMAEEVGKLARTDPPSRTRIARSPRIGEVRSSIQNKGSHTGRIQPTSAARGKK